jgi:hypothetical protein
VDPRKSQSKFKGLKSLGIRSKISVIDAKTDSEPESDDDKVRKRQEEERAERGERKT